MGIDDRHLHRPGLVEFIERYLDQFVGYDPDDPEKTSNSIYTTAGFGDGTHGLGGIKTRFCEVVQNGTETSHGSIWAYLQWTSKAEMHERVDVLDMHQQPLKLKEGTKETPNTNTTDLLMAFVCQVLPTATKTCAKLIKDGRNTPHRVSDLSGWHCVPPGPQPDQPACPPSAQIHQLELSVRRKAGKKFIRRHRELVQQDVREHPPVPVRAPNAVSLRGVHTQTQDGVLELSPSDGPAGSEPLEVAESGPFHG